MKLSSKFILLPFVILYINFNLINSQGLTELYVGAPEESSSLTYRDFRDDLRYPRCFATGCFNTECSDKPKHDFCDWKPKFRCYQFAKCRHGFEGCQWYYTAEYYRCLRRLRRVN